MTVGTGHPDWQSYAQWRSAALLDFTTNLPVNSNQTTVEIPTQNWQSLFLSASTFSASGYVLEMQIKDVFNGVDGAWTTFRTWAITANASLLVTVPAIGQSVRFKLTNKSLVNVLQPLLLVWGVNTPAQGPGELIDDNLVTVTNTNLANGAAVSLPLPHIVRGLSQVYIQNPAATANGFSAFILQLDSLGATVATIAAWHNIKDILLAQVVLPNQPVALQLFNQSGAAVANINAAFTAPGQ